MSHLTAVTHSYFRIRCILIIAYWTGESERSIQPIVMRDGPFEEKVLMGGHDRDGQAKIFGVAQRQPLNKLQPHQDSSQLRNLLDPVRGLRDQLVR